MRQPCPRLVEGRLELAGVDRLGVDADQITVIPGDEDAARAPIGPLRFQCRTQPGDVHPKGLLLTSGIIAPQLLEDAIGRHNTIDVHQQEGKQRALLVRTEIDPMTVSVRFERAEDTELHHVPPADQHRLTRNLTAVRPRYFGCNVPFNSATDASEMTPNTSTVNAMSAASVIVESGRRGRRTLLGILSIVACSAAAFSACGSSSATTASSATTTAAVETATAETVLASTTVAPAEPFRSDLYQYMVTSLDWTGKSATMAWDGTGSPGNGDPTVDFLYGPDNQQAYAFGGPTAATLEEFVAASRAANAAARSCPIEPAATSSISIGGEPAIVDEVNCGVFAISATVIHAGRVYAFFTFDQPGKEAEMRAWFGSLLRAVKFDA